MLPTGRVDQGSRPPQSPPPRIRTYEFDRIRILDKRVRYASMLEWIAVIRGRGYCLRRRRNCTHGIDFFCDARDVNDTGRGMNDEEDVVGDQSRKSSGVGA